MDPFQVRMQFLALLSRLSSSLASIHKVSSFALFHAPKCADDLWDCLLEECAHASLNARVNILHLIDALLLPGPPYKALVQRDIAQVVDLVVPNVREGLINLMSTLHVLKSWRTRRLLDLDLLNDVSKALDERRSSLHSNPLTSTSTSTSTSTLTEFSHVDILKRIEDDRERHKRLRERLWVLPVPTSIFPSMTTSSLPSSTKTSPESPAASPSERPPAQPPFKKAKLAHAHVLATSATGPGTAFRSTGTGQELAIDIEFDQLWDACEEELVDAAKKTGTSDQQRWSLTSDERTALRLERERCFPGLASLNNRT